MNKRAFSWLDWLVGYYGVVQMAHFLALAAESWNWSRRGSPALLAPPPAMGWTDQALWLLVGTGVADALVIPLSILFAWGWLRRKDWSSWLGALALGGSVFSAIIFGIGTVPIGVWGERIAYWIEAALFAPIGLLFVLFIRHLMQGGIEGA